MPESTIRIVIADDHAVVLKGLETLLTLESDMAVVATCDSGERTLEAVRQHHPDILLLDLLMPGMNGWEFCLHFRRQPALERVPIIVHSSTTNDPPPGANAIVRKPVKLDRLLSVVEEHCSPRV